VQFGTKMNRSDFEVKGQLSQSDRIWSKSLLQKSSFLVKAYQSIIAEDHLDQ